MSCGEMLFHHTHNKAAVVKVRGLGGISPLLPFQSPAIVWAPLIESRSVILCINNAKLVELEWVWGFAATWLRQVSPSPPLHKTTFNHCKAARLYDGGRSSCKARAIGLQEKNIWWQTSVIYILMDSRTHSIRVCRSRRRKRSSDYYYFFVPSVV